MPTIEPEDKPPLERVPEILNNVAVHLVEMAQAFRSELEEALATNPPADEDKLDEHPVTISGSAAFFLMIIAQNELFAGQILDVSRGATDEIDSRTKPKIIVPGIKIVSPVRLVKP